MEPIPPRVRRTVQFRQLLLQGCWNYEGMQNVGFAYCLLPALRHFYEGRPAYRWRRAGRMLYANPTFCIPS